MNVVLLFPDPNKPARDIRAFDSVTCEGQVFADIKKSVCTNVPLSRTLVACSRDLGAEAKRLRTRARQVRKLLIEHGVKARVNDARDWVSRRSAGSMSSPHDRTLRLALQTVGTKERLAKALVITLVELESYMSGSEQLPHRVYLAALDIVAQGPYSEK